MPQTPAPAKTLLTYCPQCKLGLGWGAVTQDPRLGHFVATVFHAASFVEIDPSEAVGPSEAYDAFLARMVSKYGTK
jgi:hypothetical protein